MSEQELAFLNLRSLQLLEEIALPILKQDPVLGDEVVEILRNLGKRYEYQAKEYLSQQES
jgi:hypothetical protein